MSFCTNCGAPCEEDICMSCGVRNNTIHKFCYWCGDALNENAAICLNCKKMVGTVRGSAIGFLIRKSKDLQNLICFVIAIFILVVLSKLFGR